MDVVRAARVGSHMDRRIISSVSDLREDTGPQAKMLSFLPYASS